MTSEYGTNAIVKVGSGVSSWARAGTSANQLNEKIKAKDEKGVAALLTTAQTKMAELAQKDPKQAQEYIGKIK